MMYDVVVIGAGPAGSTAAKKLAEEGCRVLLAERQTLPRYKSCSGVLIQKSMDLVQEYFGEPVPSSVTCAPAENRGMIFTNPQGKEFHFFQRGLNVWRSSFDYWLAQQAVKKGAELRDHTAVLSCAEGKHSVTVTLNGKTEEARYVLDCEGVTGTVKRKLTGHTFPYITTLQSFCKGSIHLDPHYFYAYLQPELSEYDAWFNVKEHLLVLGVSVKGAGKAAADRATHFYPRFLSYMKDRHHLQIEETLRTEQWLMPHIRPGCSMDYGIGRILFAGEAAGFLNPMGEGISAGIESGYCAACSIAAAMAGDSSHLYTDYQSRTEKLQIYMTRQWSFVASIADTFQEMK